jgi:FkbM family methyltransferase
MKRKRDNTSDIPAGVSLERCMAAYRRVVSEFGYTPVIKTGRTRLLDWDLEYVCGSALASFIDQILVRRLNDFIPDNDRPLILDCGANIGFTALNYKRQFPLAKIVAFEPDPQFAPVLRRNLERNRASDIEVVEAAAWLRDGHAAWFCEGIDGSHLVDTKSRTGTIVQTVDLARYLMEPIDLLKIDIEGTEYDLVAHLAERLQNVKNIIIECHLDQSKIVPFGNMLRVLSAAGFKVSVNCFGAWRDLIRQAPVPPNHWEQYLLVTGSRGETPQVMTDSTALPYTGISPALEWQSRLAACDAEWKLKEDEWQSRLAASENQFHALLKSYASTGRLGLERIELRAPYTREGKYGWVVMLPDLVNSADNLEDPIRSPLLLFEDDKQLELSHSPHKDICKRGRGRFSHWVDSLYFSTSDNSDPNTNGRTYVVLWRGLQGT